MIQRENYLEELIRFKDIKLIKVVTGVRRCGKSTLFELYMDYLKGESISNDQMIHVNLEDIAYESLLDYRNLYQYMIDRLNKEKKTYIFIDEVQNCPSFEKAIDSLFIKEGVDVYITGSNAYMLSGELATVLSGRYITVNMLPLSFKEYHSAHTEKAPFDQESIFQQYLKYGSFPYVATMDNNERVIHAYLEGIYNTILVKDVAKRENITDLTLLESIIKTVSSSIGSPISIKKISDTLNSSGRQVSVNTVERYLRALCDSYIFYKVDRYDVKGRQFLKTLGKYYIVDTGIRNLLLAQSSADLGHVLENIVYLELLRRGNKVSIGKVGTQEVDFIATNQNDICYYQVAASVLDENTLARELASLRAIPDHHPKILLTLDTIGDGANYEGIRQINILKWLLA